jgi:hypothetical protein
MPLIMILIGLLLIISAAHGETKTLFSLIHGDFTGQGNFVYWIASIVAVGAVGYIKPLRPLSIGFLVLILITLFLKNGNGFFAQLTSAINSTKSVPNTPATPAISGNVSNSIPNPYASGTPFVGGLINQNSGW